jgi:hypothetical protein
MSLGGFQRGLCALIASPALCRGVRRDPGHLPTAWELTPRERRRLVAIAGHRGMAANCSLYRASRLTPLWTLLPRSCFLLGAALPGELDRYWEAEHGTDLQFSSEVEAFAAYLRARLAGRRLAVPHLRETLAFEVAMQELPLLAGGPAPALRALRFTREPRALLARLDERRRPPYPDLAAGEFWLLLDARAGELRSSLLAPAAGRGLCRRQAGRPVSERAAATLARLGLAAAAGDAIGLR